MIKRKTFLVGTAVTTAIAAFGGNGLLQSNVAFAAPGISLATGYNEQESCIENGYKYTTSENIANGPHCYATLDNSTINRLANKNNTRTFSDLKKTEEWSPLNTQRYLARGTMATRKIQNAPRHPDSSKIAAIMDEMPWKLYNGDEGITTWLNVGRGIAGEDGTPIYTVDSSNPEQDYATFSSEDSRVTNYDGVNRILTGEVPVPGWAKPSVGEDKTMAVYDIATGIWRSYLYVTKISKTEYTFASGGYWYAGNVDEKRAGDDNYWLRHVQGSSSVSGMTHELLQIGLEEVKQGSINHMVGVTLANYGSKVSFPAKDSDGNLPEEIYSYSPKVGQVFTFPKSFDVEKYCDDRDLDDLTRMVMRAVKTYGGMVTDRNLFCHTFNFEHPFGIAVSARKGANAWFTDSEASALLSDFQVGAFPWGSTDWIVDDYSGTLSNSWSKDSPLVSFSDVKSNNQFYTEITTLAELGIVRGWSDGTFRPVTPVNRDAMAAFLLRATDLFDKGVESDVKSSGASGKVFVDVSKKRMFAAEMEWMKSSGISTGWKVSKGYEYRPGSATNRDAMAAFLYRWMKLVNRL